METTVKQRLESFLMFKKISKSEFGRVIGVSSAYISSMRKSIQPDKVESIALNFPELNINWLLTGNGQMLAEKEEKYSSTKGIVLPLINQVAMAGYNEDNWTSLITQCPLYSIPDIDHSAEFLIPVAGDSMSPKYEAGDLLACKMIHEVLFFQWGKTYVIDSSQGVMVKRVYEDVNNSENILLVSENSNYPPFAIPRSDVRKLALVVGVVRVKLE